MNPVQPSEETIFDFARKLDSPSLRAEYLEQACGGDSQLKERVAGLLQLDEENKSYLEEPAAGGMAATLEARQVTEKPGDSIGPFKLLQKIGEGGFGVVYMAEQSKPVRRKVALKVIKPGMDTKEVIARFEAERQALAMMDHPNIAKVFDGGETESGRPYFVMELVKGVPLTKFCDENKLDTTKRLLLFKDVCNAIQHAHQKGVIHRDIKPANVLVTLHDGKPVPKVIDFGVAKAISQDLTAKTLFTAYGQMVGTPQYMSPEQAEMTGLDIDTRSDIYSLGVLLYELLTGTTPLDPKVLRKTTYAEMQRLIREDEPPRPSRRLSELGEKTTKIVAERQTNAKDLTFTLRGELDWIVMKALDKDRNRRYDTAKGFSVDIDHYLSDEPVTACPPSQVYLFRKMIHRHRSQVVVGSLFLLALLAGLAGTTKKWLDEIQATKLADRKANEAEIAKQAASDSLEAERIASEKLRLQNQSQALVMAFDAFNSGNTTLAEELLRKCNSLSTGTASNLAWSFLQRRCEDQQSKSIDFAAIAQDAESDPFGEFYVVGFDSDEIKLFDSATDEELLSVIRPDSTNKYSRARDIELSRDGQWLAATSTATEQEGRISIWKLDRSKGSISATAYRTILTSKIDFSRVAFDGPAKQIAVIDSDGKLKIWNLSTGRLIADKQVHGWAWRSCLTFLHDGRSVMFRKTDGVAIYSLETLEEVRQIPYRNLWDAKLTPDGTSLALTGYRGTELWDLTQEEPALERALTWRRSTCCVFSEDGRYLVVNDSDHQSIWIFECQTGRVMGRFHCSSLIQQSTLAMFGAEVIAVNPKSAERFDTKLDARTMVDTEKFWYAPFGNSKSSPVVAFPTPTNGLGLWNTLTGHVTQLNGSESDYLIRCVEMDDDAKRVGLAREKQKGVFDIEIWDLEKRALEERYPDSKPISALAFSPMDHDLLLSVGAEVRLWDLRSGSSNLIKAPVVNGKRSVIAADFSPTGRHFIVGGGAWQEYKDLFDAELWSIDDSRSAKKEQVIPTMENYACVFTSESKKIAFVDLSDDSIKLYDRANANMEASLQLGSSRIFSIDIDEAHQCLVATSPSGAMTFVDLRTMEEIGTFRLERPLRHVRFIDDHDRLIVSTMDGSILQWDY